MTNRVLYVEATPAHTEPLFRRAGGKLGRAVRLAVAGAAMGVTVLPGTAAAATPEPCQRPWRSVSATFVLGDPTATYSFFGGTYAGAEGIAYKMTGEFPHSTTFTFSGYDDYDFIPSGDGYVLNDADIVPDPGSINPFQVGSLVNGTPRNYTAYFWPDSIPVPEDLENVFKLFFRSSKSSEGTGIGLDLVNRIIKHHEGDIKVNSKPGMTAFNICIPIDNQK